MKDPKPELIRGVGDSDLTERYRRAARLIAEADGLLITTGAGMGVDSGLPDFRSSQGFWAAYPALGRARLQFADVASLGTFAEDPRLAWGFYGHRLLLYRQTQPHAGFGLLRMIGERAEHGAFVFTSNVDGAFQKAGCAEARIVECHGSIHFMQCADNCTEEIWDAKDFVPRIDEAQCRLTSAIPVCPACGGVARPNVLMFSDWGWIATRSEQQQARLDEWLEGVERPTVIEIGAGNTIPTVRRFTASLGVPVIRINPEPEVVVDPRVLALHTSALVGVQGIARALLEGPWAGYRVEI